LPLYEYHCDRDGRFEVIRRFSDPPLKKCPKCGGPVQRLPSAPAIQFKGTGWYVTDYAKKSGGEGSKGEESSKGKDAGGEGKDAGGSAASGTGDSPASAGKSDTAKSEKPKKAAISGSKKDK
jgi:putative FmdB family regulatory protein